MKKTLLISTTLFPSIALATNPTILPNVMQDIRSEQIKTEIDSDIKFAKPEKQAENLSHLGETQSQQITLTREQLQQNPWLTQQLLNQAIYYRQPELISRLLEIYKTLPQQDPIMVLFAEGKIAALSENDDLAIDKYRTILAQNPNLNPVRIELAISLFNQKQDNLAKEQFEKAKSSETLPPQVESLLNAYLEALSARDNWNIDLAFNYIRDTNVNNAGSGDKIELENGGILTRSEEMMPKTAHGFAYSLDISRDFNLLRSHYLSVGNELYGKNYWDNHEYDDISNRTFVGYAHKTAKQTFRVKPFYEKRWYGGESYRWGNGARLEFSHWLTPNWQIIMAGEFTKLRYFDSPSQNGNSKLLSNTLVWARNPKQFFYMGSDFIAERTQIRQYSSDAKNLRLGWLQEWEGGISSRINLSAMRKEYKDIAKLGNISLFSFGKARKDKIYSTQLTLWKRDWHFVGITPKLVFSWRKQVSNIPEMYSYSQKNVNIIFEKSF